MNDLTNRRFECLTVKSIYKKNAKGRNRTYCLCQCDCGNKKEVYKSNLQSGATVDCGCGIGRKKRNKRNSTRRNKSHFYYKNEYREEGNIVYVKLRNTNNEMICNKEDWEKFRMHAWKESHKGYAISLYKDESKKVHFFHRMVIGAEKGEIVDHINQNRLDNRRENLRKTSSSMNSFNRKTKNKSGYSGVTYSNGKWNVAMTVNYKPIYLGRYEKLEDAIEARKSAELKYRGEYSKK